MAILSGPGRKKTEATLDAVSEETDALVCQPGETIALSIVGTYTATVQLQRSFDGGVTFYGVEDYAATGATNTQKDIIVSAPLAYKLVMTARTSGDATCILISSG